MAIDLCARVNFQVRRVVRDGVGYVGLVSSHRTQVNNDGDCKRICDAEFVLHPSHGVIGVAMMSEGTLCFGGFAPIDGTVQGALRGVLSGHITIWFSNTYCIPQAGGRARAIDCQSPPDARAPCYLPPHEGGWDCIYCVEWNTKCTIEAENVDEYPCSALGTPGGGRVVMPSGLTVIPEPGMYDINGSDEPFEAGSGRTGKVTYHLQSSIRARVEPLWYDPEYPDWCGSCGNWMCVITLAYLDAFEAWQVVCTEVLKTPQPDSPGACCAISAAGEPFCAQLGQEDCYEMHDGVWRGPGTVCGLVDCATSCYALPYPCGACCLPNGLCAYLTAEECEAHNGAWQGPMSQCSQVSCTAHDPNLAPRLVELRFGDAIGWVNAELDDNNRACWHLYDQYCFSAEPPLDESGDSLCGYQNPCWANGGDTPLLRSLDTLGIDCDMRWAESDRYPHLEPECVQIANAAFARVGELLVGLEHADRFAHFDDVKLNRWQQVVTEDCRTAPSIWPVSVIPHQTSCAFPADLVVWQISALLYLSGDPANADVDGYHSDGPFGSLRIAAVFKCAVRLKVRLQPGWESNRCAALLANASGNPCDPAFVDPGQHLILAGGSCSRVPLELSWEGLVGPRPWSSGDFDYVKQPGESTACCQLACAIHGLLIPGVVNATSDPDGLQRYGGDVVLAVNQIDTHCGCGP